MRGRGGKPGGGDFGGGDSVLGRPRGEPMPVVRQLDVDGARLGPQAPKPEVQVVVHGTRLGPEVHGPAPLMVNHPEVQVERHASPTGRLIKKAISLEYIYAILGLSLGLACIIGGVILGLRGVTGSTSWTASFFGLHSAINDAAPGVVLFVVGIFLVLITRPKIKLRDVRDA